MPWYLFKFCYCLPLQVNFQCRFPFLPLGQELTCANSPLHCYGPLLSHWVALGLPWVNPALLASWIVCSMDLCFINSVPSLAPGKGDGEGLLPPPEPQETALPACRTQQPLPLCHSTQAAGKAKGHIVMEQWGIVINLSQILPLPL